MSALMIHATIRITLPSKTVKEALEILGSEAERTKVQPGCLSSRVYHDIQDRNVIMVEEMWRSEEELERHLRSYEYHKVLLVMEMALKQPEIRFDTISSSTGIENIEKARSHAK
jgi:quinol monooxygenase YgiN